MKKSFKKAVAVLLAVLMVTCSVPFAALAETSNAPDIQLQFGSFFDFGNMDLVDLYDTAVDTEEGVADSALYAPALDYTDGTLSLNTSAVANWSAEFDDVFASDAHTYGVGDYFTVTAIVENISKLYAFEAAVAYSDNIEPAGVTATNSGYAMYSISDADVDPVIFAGEPLVNNGAADLYDGINSGIPGDLSYVNTENKAIIFSAAAEDGSDGVAITGVTNSSKAENLVDPATGDLGYDYEGKLVVATFAFKIVAAGPITFSMAKPNAEMNYNGAFFAANKAEGMDPENYTTYESTYNDVETAGANQMTFMKKNEYTAPVEVKYTVTFKDAAGAVISSTEYNEGDTVTVPELPATKNNGVTGHSTFAWDKTPATTATANATYQVVETAVAHKLKSEVVTPATCNKIGTTKYTCEDCDYENTLNDIPMLTKHTPAAAVEENRVEATCSKAGSYDSVVYCSVCKQELSRTSVTIDKTAHNFGEWVYNGDAVYVTATNYTDGTETATCGTCGETKTQSVPDTGLLRARSANTEFASAVKMCIGTRIDTANKFDRVYAKFIRADGVETLVYSDDEINHYLTSQNTMFKFGITPQGLNAEVKIIFYGERNGRTYWGPEYTYNLARDYFLKQINNNINSDPVYAKLLVELMYFGYENQIKSGWDIEHPLPDLLSAEAKALHTTAVPSDLVKIQNTSYEVVPNAKAWKSVNLEFGDATKIHFTTDVYTPNENTKAVVTVEGEKEPFVYEYSNPAYTDLFSVITSGPSAGRMKFVFPDLPAKRLKAKVYVQILEGETPITNVFEYSPQTFALNQLNKYPNDQDTKITNQLMRYADAAMAHFLR